MNQDKNMEFLRIAGGHVPLRELRERFPVEWAGLMAELQPIMALGDADGLAERLRRLRAEAEVRLERVRQSGGNTMVVTGALPFVVRHRMAGLWLRTAYLQSMADPGPDGKVRLALWDGMIMQRIFFSQGLTRRPVSAWRYRWLWPLVRRRQRGLMLCLVQQKGIYCFYSRSLIRALAERIGSQPCLEIAAGDGTLARFLKAEGVAIRATDSQEWSSDIAYPADVEKVDAAEAIRRSPAPVVLCSWPPAGNGFEKAVLAASSVELYIVIASARRFAAGNWDVYRKQDRFQMTEDAALSRQVLPAEIEARVLVFDRKPPSAG
jgi:hypothetical protein